MPLAYKIAKRILLDHEFVMDHQTGSHQIWKKGEAQVVVPQKKEFAIGTAKSIIKRIAQLSDKDSHDIVTLYSIKF